MRRTLTLVVLILLMSACTASVSPITAAPLRICTNAQSPSAVNVALAAERNYFADEGLDATVTSIDSGTTATNALIAGDVDVCQIAGASVVSAIAAGAQLVIIGGVVNQQPYYLVGQPELTTMQDLVGGSIAISSAGGSSDLSARRALELSGLRPDTDVTIAAVGGSAERLAALESGNVSAALLLAPQAMLAMERGYSALFDFTAIDEPYQHTAIVTTRSFLADQPEQLRRFLRANARAITTLRDDREAAITTMASFFALDPVANRAALELTHEQFILRYLNPDLQPSLAGLQSLITETAAEVPAAADLTPADLVDTTLLPD